MPAYRTKHAEILPGDCLEVLPTLPDRSVHLCVTSPPYWGLRDYGTAEWEGGDPKCDHKNRTSHQKQGRTSQRAGRANVEEQRSETYFHACPCGAQRIDQQIGQEETPQQYVDKMVRVFREVRRVLRDEGTLWLNLGDSYTSGNREGHGTRVGYKQQSNRGMNGTRDPKRPRQPEHLKPKDLVGIPWMVAFALRDDGWYLRCDTIWAKPNCMPGSQRDRPTRSHEYVFQLSKSAHYFYDGKAVETTNAEGEQTALRSVWSIPTKPFKGSHFAVFPPKLVETCVKAGSSKKGCCPHCSAPWERMLERERVATRPGKDSKVYVPDPSKKQDNMGNRMMTGFNERWKEAQKSKREYEEPPLHPDSPYRRHNGDICGNRDPERHCTVTKTIGWEPTCKCEDNIPVPCTVLDPFSGSATTGLVAVELGRKYLGIELNPEYCAMGLQRLEQGERRKGLGLF